MEQGNEKTEDVARETGDDLRDAAERAAEDARQTAEDVSDQVRTEARERAGRAKNSVASEISNVADALRGAAEDMRDGSPQERTFGQIASGLADAADAVRDRDLGQIVGDVSEFARRNPLAFLGGAALAGFAATRFAKASSAGGYSARSSYADFESVPDSESDRNRNRSDMRSTDGSMTQSTPRARGPRAPATAQKQPTAFRTEGDET